MDARLRNAVTTCRRTPRGQLRKSGDPYITHPLAVATILAELGMDTTTLVAALLHDTVEDTGRRWLRSTLSSVPKLLTSSMGPSDESEYGNASESETIRKMIVAMARDPRVLSSNSLTVCTTCAHCDPPPAKREKPEKH